MIVLLAWLQQAEETVVICENYHLLHQAIDLQEMGLTLVAILSMIYL